MKISEELTALRTSCSMKMRFELVARRSAAYSWVVVIAHWSLTRTQPEKTSIFLWLLKHCLLLGVATAHCSADCIACAVSVYQACSKHFLDWQRTLSPVYCCILVLHDTWSGENWLCCKFVSSALSLIGNRFFLLV